MKIIVCFGKKKELIKLGNEAVLCVLNGSFPSLYYKKILKLIGATKNDTYYVLNNIKKRILKRLSHLTPFSEIDTKNIFLKNMKNIIKNINTGEKMTIRIHSDKEDDRIFDLISSINNFCSLIHLITKDDAFYEKVANYALYNYGLAVNLKQFDETKNVHLDIVLNFSERNFSEESGYIINLSDNLLSSQKVLIDISPLNLPANLEIDIQKCIFLEKDCQKFNLIWKNSQKSVDKSEK